MRRADDKGVGKPGANAKLKWRSQPKHEAKPTMDLAAIRLILSFLSQVPALDDQALEAAWKALVLPATLSENVSKEGSSAEQIFNLFIYLQAEQLLLPEIEKGLNQYFATKKTMTVSPSPRA